MAQLTRIGYHGPLQIATFWELRHLLSLRCICVLYSQNVCLYPFHTSLVSLGLGLLPVPTWNIGKYMTIHHAWIAVPMFLVNLRMMYKISRHYGITSIAAKVSLQKSDKFSVVSTHLKNISQVGTLPHIGVKIKSI